MGVRNSFAPCKSRCLNRTPCFIEAAALRAPCRAVRPLAASEPPGRCEAALCVSLCNRECGAQHAVRTPCRGSIPLQRQPPRLPRTARLATARAQPVVPADRLRRRLNSFVGRSQFIRAMQVTLPESDAVFHRGRSLARAVSGCPSVGGQRTGGPLQRVAVREFGQSNKWLAVAPPHAVSGRSPVATPTALVAQAAFCYRSRPTRRSSRPPSASAELIRWAFAIHSRHASHAA